MKTSNLINNTARVKQTNMELIRTALKHLGKATRTDIAKSTDLSIATCGNLLAELVKNGEVLESDLDNNRGGRPARTYLYNKNYSLVLGIALHKDKDINYLRYIIANLFGEVLEDKSFTYNHSLTMDTIISHIDILIDKWPSIKAISIGIPGYTDKNGLILNNDITELNNVPIVKLLNTKYDLNVSVSSSPQFTAYGYYTNHTELHQKPFVTLLAPEDHPVGAGIIINDTIYKGFTNLAGEIGYASIWNDSTSSYVASIEHTISSIITIIGPCKLLLTGNGISQDIFNQTIKSLSEKFPKEFLPEFEFKADATDDYISGVIQTAINSMTNNVQLVIR